MAICHCKDMLCPCRGLLKNYFNSLFTMNLQSSSDKIQEKIKILKNSLVLFSLLLVKTAIREKGD